jgi:hypothetical protein
VDDVRESDNPQAMKTGPNPGLLRPPILFLCAILLGIALNRAWPLHFMSSGIRLLGPVVTACAVVLFLLSYQEISPSRYFRPGEQAFHCDRANRSLPVQSQSHLSGFHPIRVRIVRLVEQRLATGNARSGCRLDRDGCDSTGRKVPRTQLQ